MLFTPHDEFQYLLLRFEERFGPSGRGRHRSRFLGALLRLSPQIPLLGPIVPTD